MQRLKRDRIAILESDAGKARDAIISERDGLVAGARSVRDVAKLLQEDLRQLSEQEVGEDADRRGLVAEAAQDPLDQRGGRRQGIGPGQPEIARERPGDPFEGQERLLAPWVGTERLAAVDLGCEPALPGSVGRPIEPCCLK